MSKMLITVLGILITAVQVFSQGLPAVSTTTASGVTAVSAFLGGNVTDDSSSTVTERGVVYSSTNAVPDTLDTRLIAGIAGLGAYSLPAVGLTHSVTYYYRAYAINGVGISYGSVDSFITSDTLAVLSLTAPSFIFSNSANPGGLISDDGGSPILERGIVYSTSSVTPDTNNSKAVHGVASAGGYAVLISGLTHSQTYYFRAYAITALGIAYSAADSFTTADTLASVSASAPSYLYSTAANPGGAISDDGGSAILERGVVYSTSNVLPDTNNTKAVHGVAATGSYALALSGLTHSQTYYFRAYAITALGIAYSTADSFTTADTLAVLNASAPTFLFSNSANPGGMISDDGGSPILERGVVYSTTNVTPDTNDTKAAHLTATTGSYAVTLTGLTHSTTYYFRAYAITALGISYSGATGFTTIDTVPFVSSSPIDSLRFATAYSGGNVTDNGGQAVTARGVCWSTSPNPTVFNSHTTNGSGNGSFTSYLSGLTGSTTYYLRAYATSTVGTGYGNQITFTTPPQPFANLAVTAFNDNPNPLEADLVKYVVYALNHGPDNATGVAVNSLLPRGVKLLSSVATKGSYDSISGEWVIGSMINGEWQMLTLNCQVDYYNSAYDFRDFYNYSAVLTQSGAFTGSAVGGKIAAGTNLTLTGVAVGGQLQQITPTPAVVYAGNHLDFGSGIAYNGNVAYGNTTNLPDPDVTYPQGALVNGNTFNFAHLSPYISMVSGALTQYAVNGSKTVNGSAISLSGTDPYLNVFSISQSEFNAALNISVDVPNGSVALVNVYGGNLAFTGSVYLSGKYGEFVLFNFPAASAVSLTGSLMNGTLIAPNANVTLTGSTVRGQLVAKNLQSIASHDNVNFIGYIPLNRHIVLAPYVSASDTADSVSNNNFAQTAIDVNTTTPWGPGGTGAWSVAATLPNTEYVTSMARLNPSSVLAGTFNGKIYRVANDGTLDTVINTTMDSVAQIWSLAVNDSGHIFAGTNRGILRSNNGGSSWSYMLSGYDTRALLIAGDSSLYAGTWGYGVFRSTDGGYTWAQRNQGIGSTVIQSLLDRRWDSTYTVFAGGFLKAVSASYNHGGLWRELSLPYQYVTSLAKTSQGIIFAATQWDGVYRSADNGNTFTKMAGIPEGPYNLIRVDGGNNIFAATTEQGIYASADLGQSWSYLGLGGFTTGAIWPMANNRLLVGGKGKLILGTYSVTGTSEQENTLPTAYALEQNYPNPFNPATTIRFSLPAAGNVVLTIYNQLGQRVTELVNTQMAAGNHSVNWSAGNFSSGVYFYELRVNNYRAVKKLMLVK